MTKTQLTIHMPAKKLKLWCNPKNFHRFVDRLPPCVIHCFTGNREQAIKYLQVYFESLSFSWHTYFLSIFSSSIMSAKINFIASYARIFLMLIKISFSPNIITIIAIINIITIITVIFMITIISVIFISPARLLHWADWLPVEGQVWKWSAQNLGGGGQCILLISSKGFWIISISSFWLQLIDLILFETVGDPVGQAPGGNRRSLHVSWPTLWESHAATNIPKDHNDKQMMVMLWRVKIEIAYSVTAV